MAIADVACKRGPHHSRARAALRGAVARRFGAQTVYRLWALPLVRLVLPPIVLPAWLAPRTTADAVHGIETVVMVDPSPVSAVADAEPPPRSGTSAAQPASPQAAS